MTNSWSHAAPPRTLEAVQLRDAIKPLSKGTKTGSRTGRWPTSPPPCRRFEVMSIPVGTARTHGGLPWCGELTDPPLRAYSACTTPAEHRCIPTHRIHKVTWTEQVTEPTPLFLV